jgi:hypothetical protein
VRFAFNDCESGDNSKKEENNVKSFHAKIEIFLMVLLRNSMIAARDEKKREKTP